MIYRDVMLNGCLPDPMQILPAAVEAIAVLLLGLLLFAKKQDQFILDL